MRFFKTKKNTEDKIKEATFELLADKGFAKLSMRDIAKKAQTAVGQLTYYYGTKEHLIISVIEEMTNEFIDELEKYMNKSSDKIKAISTFFDELLERDERVYKVLIDFTAQSMWNETFNIKLKGFFSKVSNMIELAYIEKGIEKENAKDEAEIQMALISGKAIQNVFKKKFSSSKNFLEKERKLFNAKPANGLL